MSFDIILHENWKMAGMGLMKNRLDEYKSDANEVLTFKLVRDAKDLEKTEGFHPEMSHQLFGDQESIFGYKDLEIQMYYSAARLNTYLHLTYADKVTPERDDGLQPDNVIETLAKRIPPGYYSNIDEFSTALTKEANFKPFGEKIHSYCITKDGAKRQFEIYKADIDMPGFREYHARLQTFILFFIDAASLIQVDDDRWRFYLLFEKYECDGDGRGRYAIAGYMTVYNYYAYPSRVRPKISQVLVLPPFQKQGHGAQLIQTFYNSCYGNSEILDIAVEDPSEDFQRLRDYVDAKNCMKLKNFQPEKLKHGFNDDMEWEAREKLKINKRQARRVYEILRLKATDASNKDEYKTYRLDVKRRLNIPFQKSERDNQKLKKALRPDELMATLSSMTMEQRYMYLENAFDEHIEIYKHVIERLNIG